MAHITRTEKAMSLAHTRSWKTHLAFCVVQLALAYPFIFFLVAMFSPSAIVYAISGFLLVGFTALFGWEIYFAMTRRHDFHCVLEDGRIRCECPSSSTGSSFDLLIADLVRITEDDGRLTLISANDEQYWLTSNYGNPAGRFVELLTQCNPSIVIERL